MKKDSVLVVRLNSNLKDDFQTIANSGGFSVSEIIEGCIKDIVKRGYIPLNIRSKLEPRKNSILSIPFIKQSIDEILKNGHKNIKTISLFGSYSKGEATSKSDVDIFVEADNSFSLFQLTQFQNELEGKLGKKVDVITSGSDDFINHIRKEKIQLYEREK